MENSDQTELGVRLLLTNTVTFYCDDEYIFHKTMGQVFKPAYDAVLERNGLQAEDPEAKTLAAQADSELSGVLRAKVSAEFLDARKKWRESNPRRASSLVDGEEVVLPEVLLRRGIDFDIDSDDDDDESYDDDAAGLESDDAGDGDATFDEEEVEEDEANWSKVNRVGTTKDQKASGWTSPADRMGVEDDDEMTEDEVPTAPPQLVSKASSESALSTSKRKRGRPPKAKPEMTSRTKVVRTDARLNRRSRNSERVDTEADDEETKNDSGEEEKRRTSIGGTIDESEPTISTSESEEEEEEEEEEGMRLSIKTQSRITGRDARGGRANRRISGHSDELMSLPHSKSGKDRSQEGKELNEEEVLKRNEALRARRLRQIRLEEEEKRNTIERLLYKTATKREQRELLRQRRKALEAEELGLTEQELPPDSVSITLISRQVSNPSSSSASSSTVSSSTSTVAASLSHRSPDPQLISQTSDFTILQEGDTYTLTYRQPGTECVLGLPPYVPLEPWIMNH